LTFDNERYLIRYLIIWCHMKEFAVPEQSRTTEMLGRVRAMVPDLDAATVVFALSILGQVTRILDAMDAHFGRYGLSQGRYVVLLALLVDAGHAWTPAALSAQVGVTRATMTGLLDRLEKDGFIERRPHPTDRRSTLIVLRPSGRAKLGKMLPDHFRRVAAALATVSTTDRARTVRLLTETGNAFDSLTKERQK